MSALERRDLLRALLALGCSPLARAGSSPEQDALAALVPAELEESARRVGERCRAAGVPADESALLAGYAGTTPADMAAFLAARVRADFAADRLLSIGPWWLAESECRVLALL
ncbi:MAG: hypothetical protein EXS08_00445 [Planctomycetes bacterium]|nr:hypothetical protein [Planctomycetota bacterium]